MHRAALSAAGTTGSTKEFSHHSVDIAALGNTMAMAAVGRGNVVVVLKVHADADRARFLSRIEVRIAGNIAGPHLLHDTLFEPTNHSHGSIGLDELFFWQLQSRHPSHPLSLSTPAP